MFIRPAVIDTPLPYAVEIARPTKAVTVQIGIIVHFKLRSLRLVTYINRYEISVNYTYLYVSVIPVIGSMANSITAIDAISKSTRAYNVGDTRLVIKIPLYAKLSKLRSR